MINNKFKNEIDTGKKNVIKKNVKSNSYDVHKKLFNKNQSLSPSFNVGDAVMYRNHFKNSVKWLPARVVEKVSSHTYRINVYNNIRYVHENQIRKSTLEDRHHPTVLLSQRRSWNDDVKAKEKFISPSNSPRLNESSSSRFETPLSSPVFLSPKSNLKKNSPPSESKQLRRVQFTLPERTRSRTQNMSEENLVRRSSRTRARTLRYGIDE